MKIMSSGAAVSAPRSPSSYDRAGHEVVIIERATDAFDRLPIDIRRLARSVVTGPTRTCSAGPEPKARTSCWR